MNEFNLYTPQQIAEVAVSLTKGRMPLSSVVTRYGDKEFKDGRGKTVFLNVPGALVAHGRALDDTTTAIVLDSLKESQEPISLDVHAYSALGLSEQDLTLDLVDFGKQVLKPQVDAVIDKTEATVEKVLATVAVDESIAYTAGSPIKLFTAGRAALRARGIDVAASDLVAIVGANTADALLDSGALDFDKTGAADALRNGSLGRLRGFETIESGRIGDDEVIFMTRSALFLAHRAPATPYGAAFGQTVTTESFSLRYLRDYDPMHTQERSLVSTFLDAGVLPLYTVTRTQDSKPKQGDSGFTAGTATVTEVPGGAVVKASIAA